MTADRCPACATNPVFKMAANTSLTPTDLLSHSESLVPSVNFSDPMDISEYISHQLGPPHLALQTLIPLTVIYGIIFTLGFLGNISTCLVVFKYKYMQTPTNVYLSNLAISDLVTGCIAMPLELSLLWHQYPWTLGELACDVQMVIRETVTFSSILTIVAFTIERYVAICHPMNLSKRSKMIRAHQALFFIWMASIGCSLPWIFFNKVNVLKNPITDDFLPGSSWCAIPWNEETDVPLYLMIGSTFMSFIIPVTIVILLYTKIFFAMKAASRIHRSSQHPFEEYNGKGETTFIRERKAVLKVLVAVVLMFCVCWIPFHVQRLMFVLVTLQGNWNPQTGYAHYVLFLASGVGYYLSSSINPLLYSVLSRRFRRGFRDLFKQSLSTTTNFRQFPINNGPLLQNGLLPRMRPALSGLSRELVPMRPVGEDGLETFKGRRG